MKLEKIKNYNVDVKELQEKISKLENKKEYERTELEKNLLRKYKSEIDEYVMLEWLNDNKNIKEIMYNNDYTKEYKTNKKQLTIQQQIQNKMNMRGIDLYVLNVAGELIEIDLKVIQYDELHRKTNTIMFGDLINDKWGCENFIFQTHGMWNKKGWGTDETKLTKILLIYIKATNKIYMFNYKNLTNWLNELIETNKINDYESVIFDKVWDNFYKYYKTFEMIVSIPTNEIPDNAIMKIIKVGENK